MTDIRKGDIQAVLGWLAGGALSGVQSQDVLAELCEKMVACGIPLWRVAVFVTTLHPDIMGRRFLWQAEFRRDHVGGVVRIPETRTFAKARSPTVYATREPLRRRLADRRLSDRFSDFRDLRAEGVTDYAAFPLLFTDSTVHVGDLVDEVRRADFHAETVFRH